MDELQKLNTNLMSILDEYFNSNIWLDFTHMYALLNKTNFEEAFQLLISFLDAHNMQLWTLQKGKLRILLTVMAWPG